ncbi:MAG: N-acetylneuraminate synthase family protein [Armatimonadota bacterium]|nr:N-acetylneuraminate synthase family protein [Armatimonadota bacterium]
MTELAIGGRPVGGDNPVYIVAEGGVNHGCDMDVALEMIDEAAAAGADAIKFQTYCADTLTTRWAPRYWDHPEESGTQYAIYKRSDDFGQEEHRALFLHARDVGIEWLTTPFDLHAIEWLAELDMAAYKIASADLTNWPLVRAAAETGKPVILSSGSATLDEIRASVDQVLDTGNEQIVLLHCILAYPAPVEEMHLRWIPRLIKEFPELVIGLSCHSIPDPCVTVSTAAVALGAKVIEKHFTLDTTLPGDDHYLSVDPPLLRRMVDNIRLVEGALGSPEITVLPCEQAARKSARRSVVAAVDIPAGTVLGREHLIMKRPGTGVSPTMLQAMLGRTAIRDIEEDQLVTWEDVEGGAPEQ